jgi:hypothetical protein
MFAEATAAGYMARSDKQFHNPNGTWGKYEYFVGMPEDVLAAVQKAGVAIAPQPRGPHEGLPHAQNDFTNHKEQSSQKTESKNANHHPRLLPMLEAAQKSPSSDSPKPHRAGRLPGKEVLQNEIARRIGGGDVGQGWQILAKLPASRLDELTARQRRGLLTDLELSDALATLELSGARGQAT